MDLKDGFYHPSIYWPKAIKRSLPYWCKNTYITNHALERMNERGISLCKNIDFRDWKVIEAEVRKGKLYGIRIRTKRPDCNNQFLVMAVTINSDKLKIISMWNDDGSMQILNPSYIKG